MDAVVAALAAERCDLGGFRDGLMGAFELRLRFGGLAPAAAPREAIALGPGGLQAGACLVKGDDLQAWIPQLPPAAEAAVRAAYAVAFERQGGLLLHAAGIAFPGGDGAWLAVGPSGCGKSTLSQHCADAGAEILSDETVGWLPDGTLWATPFRSSARFTRRGPPAARALSVLAFLEHGASERLEPLHPADVVRRLLPQVYRAPGAPVLHRAAVLTAQRGAGGFRFQLRDDPGAAAFVREARGVSGLGARRPSG